MHTLASWVARCGMAAWIGMASAGIGPARAAEGMAAPPVLPQTAAAWRQTALDDIEEAVRLTRENHPGTFDPANPAFPAHLDEARRRALALAARVDGAASYVAAIQAFNATLGDGHAGIAPRFDFASQVQRRWPGFVTVWREPGLFVYASEPGGPAVGAQVLSCDGKPVRQRIEDNVFSFAGRSSEPGRWWERARQLFVDAANPFVQLPARCRFSDAGKVVERALAWKPLDAQADAWLKESYNGPTLPVGLTEPRKGLFWAAMPSFQPDEAQRAAYRAMTAAVADDRRRFLEADAVVIDLRHNQGGSSLWSLAFAEALWGQDRVRRRMIARSARTEIWWRASPGNTAHVTAWIQQFTDEKQVEFIDWAKRTSAGMQAALARGDKYYVEKVDAPAAPAASSDTDPPPFTRPVYVIVPGQCASACLDALDVFTSFANTTLIGAPSSADSTYMEVRLQPLRSGVSAAIIPNKMYVNRARANGQAYLPAIYANDVDWSTASFRAVVERDLARPR